MDMLITVVYIFLPAAVANMFAIISRYFPFTDWLGVPLDGGRSYRGKRILGNGKTLRGFIFGVLMASLVGGLLGLLYENNESIQDLIVADYATIELPFVFGAVLGFGGLLGDSVKSFFKRRVGIKRGQPWFPFDQSDFVIGSTLLSLLFVQFDPEIYLVYLVTFPIGHIVFKYIGYLLKIDDKPI